MSRRAPSDRLVHLRALQLLNGLLWLAVLVAPSESVAQLQPLGGTLLVSTRRGLAMVDPVSGDAPEVRIGPPGATPAGVAWSADRRQIAVSIRVHQTGETAPGSDVLVLDASAAFLSTIQRDQPGVALLSPAWLPTGEIVYERSKPLDPPTLSRVEASSTDGSSRRVLASGARLPGVSPDGGLLAYVAPGQPADQLALRNLATGDTTLLVENASEGFVYFSRPRFSPDGRVVAFGASGGPTLSAAEAGLVWLGAGWRGGLFAAPRPHGPGWDVWTVNSDGSGLRQATHFDYEDDLSVTWSPDGQWLAAYSPNALYLVPMAVAGPATPIARGGPGEPDWAADQLQPGGS
jgi:Tol biopolymer transport system component